MDFFLAGAHPCPPCSPCPCQFLKSFQHSMIPWWFHDDPMMLSTYQVRTWNIMEYHDLLLSKCFVFPKSSIFECYHVQAKSTNAYGLAATSRIFASKSLLVSDSQRRGHLSFGLCTDWAIENSQGSKVVDPMTSDDKWWQVMTSKSCLSICLEIVRLWESCPFVP